MEIDGYFWLYIYYYTVYIFALLSTTLLLYTIFKVGNFCAKPCLVMLLNQALADFLICTVLALLVPRRLPVGDSIVVFAYGICGLIHPLTCQIFNIMWLIFLAQNIMSMTLSFFYRYFVLYHRAIETKYAILICSIPYMTGIPLLIVAQLNTISGDTLLAITSPHNITIPNGTVNFGYQYYLSSKLLIVHIYAFYSVPIYCLIMFYLRYKVMVYLDRGFAIATTLSQQTLDKHRALVKVLSVQACLPILHLVNIVFYYLEQSQILQMSDFDLSFLMCLHLLSATGGVVSLVILKPFRLQVLILFKRITSYSSMTKTENLSNSLPPLKNPSEQKH